MAALHSAIKEITDDIIKPATDVKSYRALKLKNEMSILIISDPEADKSAASMNVNVGHLYDPTGLPGLAHFCEHMLFMGSEKYPGENAYHDFILSHGGFANAYTGLEDTNFSFEIGPGQFKEAFDMFAQFFLCPLFTESATNRELKAVNSEHEKNVQEDCWRYHQLRRSLSCANHDYQKFGTGNLMSLETLPMQKGINTREELLSFHKKYYSSNLMGLAVLCKESLDDMTTYVCELFGNTANKMVKERSWTEHPYGEAQLRRRVLVTPVKDLRSLELLWPFEDLHQWWESKAEQYMTYLIGHEGPGSLLSELKARGWANFLRARKRAGAKGFSFIYCSVDLSEHGLEHIDDIIAVIYQYIKMMRTEGPQQWIVDELKDLDKMNFRFKDQQNPRPIVSSLSKALRMYPLEEVLSGPCLWKTYNPEKIQELMDKLVPENMVSTVVSQSFASKSDKTEQWYGIKYSIEPHDGQLEAMWRDPEANPALKLPLPNAFIPHDFELCERDPEHTPSPRIIKNTALSRCWFRQDDEFKLPKGCVSLVIESPMAGNTPLNVGLSWLYSSLFNDSFTEHSYDASLTELTYNLYRRDYGLLIEISGYTDKLSTILATIMTALTEFKPDAKNVAIFREKYIRALKNFDLTQPTQQAFYKLGILQYETMWTTEEMLEKVDELTTENIASFIPQLFASVHVEFLIYGNFTQVSALKLVDIVENSLTTKMESKPLPYSQQGRAKRCVQLPNDSSYLYTSCNDTHSSSCVVNYYQLGLEDTHTGMLLELLVQIIREPCFDRLRTKEQLGYLLWAYMRQTNGVRGLSIVVLSLKHPEYVDHRIESFLSSVKDLLENMTVEDYEKHVAGLITRRLTKPKKMKDKQRKLWQEILDESYCFNRDEIETDHVRSITKDEVTNFFTERIARGAKERQKLSIHIVSKEHRESFTPEGEEVENFSRQDDDNEVTVIDNHVDFKKSLHLLPLPMSALELPSSV